MVIKVATNSTFEKQGDNLGKLFHNLGGEGVRNEYFSQAPRQMIIYLKDLDGFKLLAMNYFFHCVKCIFSLNKLKILNYNVSGIL